MSEIFDDLYGNIICNFNNEVKEWKSKIIFNMNNKSIGGELQRQAYEKFDYGEICKNFRKILEEIE